MTAEPAEAPKYSWLQNTGEVTVEVQRQNSDEMDFGKDPGQP